MEKETVGVSLADAIAEKHLDVKSGKFTSPSNGMTYTLKEAVEHGMVDGESAQFTNPGNKKVYTLKEALENRLLDQYGKWTSPLTGEYKLLLLALGYIYLHAFAMRRCI